MNLQQRLENFKGPVHLATCPGCKKKIKAVILSEYTNFIELYHDDIDCETLWRYSTYVQCKHLQQRRERQIAQDLKKEYEKYAWIGHSIITITFLMIFPVIIFPPLIPPAVVVIILIALHKNNEKKTAKKMIRKKAREQSYNIKSFFSKIKNHYYDPNYLKEAKQYSVYLT